MIHAGHVRAQHRRTDHVQRDCEQGEKNCDSASLIVRKGRHRERTCNDHRQHEFPVRDCCASDASDFAYVMPAAEGHC